MAFGSELFALGHLAQTFPHKDCVWYTYERKWFSGIHRMGCTYERKQLGFDASPDRTRAHFAPAGVPGGPIPDGFWVVWEGPPYHPHSLGDGSKCHRGKGLKTVCIERRCTSVCSWQIILQPNNSVTYNFSTCTHYLTENHLSFPSPPCWVQHSYLSKRAPIDPLYLWVIGVSWCVWFFCEI